MLLTPLLFVCAEIRVSNIHTESGEYSGELGVIDEGEEALIHAENERRKAGEEMLPHSHSGLTKRDVELLSEYL